MGHRANGRYSIRISAAPENALRPTRQADSSKGQLQKKRDWN
jgi:hypothetical protein